MSERTPRCKRVAAEESERLDSKYMAFRTTTTAALLLLVAIGVQLVAVGAVYQDDKYVSIARSETKSVEETEVSDMKCVYGEASTKLKRVLRKQIELTTLKVIALVGITLVGGCICYIFLSLPAFAFSFAAACIVCDVMSKRWVTWEYFGPGVAYAAGVSGNRWVLVQHAALCAANKLLQVVGTAVLARHAFLVEDARVPRWLTAVRVALGSVAALGIIAYGAAYAFTSGVASHYVGRAMQLNPLGCSGPLQWGQLRGYARFSDMTLYLAPAWLWVYTPIWIAMPLTLSAIVCSSLTVARRHSRYHSTRAVYNLIVLVPALVWLILWPRRKRWDDEDDDDGNKK